MHSLRSSFCLLLTLLSCAPWGLAQNQFRGDASHSGTPEARGPEQLKAPRWSFQTEGPVLSSPTLAGGLLYVGSDDTHLYALEADTGSLKWKYKTDTYVRSSAAVGKGLVVFSSFDGKVHALDAATGEPRWSTLLPNERKFAAPGIHGYLPRSQVIPDSWDLWQASPTLGEDTVYVAGGDCVQALELATGKLKWQFFAKDVVHSSPALAEGLLFFGSFDRLFYALDASTGAVKWTFATKPDAEKHNLEGIHSSPTVANGTVYFGCRDRNLYALEAKSGKERWRHEVTWINTSPTLAQGIVYASSSIPALFLGVDAATGKETHRIDLQFPSFSSPAIAGKRAYVGAFQGKLFAIDLETKAVLWTFQSEASKARLPDYSQADGSPNYEKLFGKVAFYESMYVAMDRLFSLGAFISSPLVHEGRLYIGCTDGRVYALD